MRFMCQTEEWLETDTPNVFLCTEMASDFVHNVTRF